MPHTDEPFRWEDLDQRLVTPKISAIAERMHKRAADGERRIAQETLQGGNAAGYLHRLFAFHEQLANDWAADYYAAHCEAWQQQGRSVSPAFIRAVRDRVIIPVIQTRKETVHWEQSLRTTRTREPLNTVAFGAWAQGMDRLASKWSSRLEADAVAAEYAGSDRRNVEAAPEPPRSGTNPTGEVIDRVRRRNQQQHPRTENTIFSVSDDYRSVNFRGKSYSLTSNQSKMLGVLHDAYKAGHPDVGKDKLLNAIENETSQVRDSWRKSPLWKALIVSKTRGTYRLNI